MENKFNASAVSKEFKQYNNLLKLFSGVHSEYHRSLIDGQQKTDDFSFDKGDQKVFAFKHSVYNYLRENEEVMSKRSEVLEKTKSSSSSSSFISGMSGKSIKEQVNN